MDDQLYMHSGSREFYLGRHDFYVKEFKSRILSQFNDLDGDADKFEHEEYERLGQYFDPDRHGQDEFYETAHDNSIAYYLQLTDMQHQMRLSGLAGIYHQWEKDVRGFFEKEIRHVLLDDDAEKKAWGGDFAKIFAFLNDYGWDARSLPFYEPMNQCRLIVNVYKHGKIKVLRDVVRAYPQYFKDRGVSCRPWIPPPSHDDLVVEQADFDRLANAFHDFWLQFPERLYRKSS